jgi:hypothetical protein
MAESDVAPEHPCLNERFEPPQGGTLRTPSARGRAVAESKIDLQLNCNDALSVPSNAAELRRQSHHVFGVLKENRTLMTRRDGASELPKTNEGCDTPQGGTLRNPPARGPAVTVFKTELHLNSNEAARWASELTRNLTNGIDFGGGNEQTQGGTRLTPPSKRHSIEGFEPPQGVTPRTPPARGPAVPESKTDLHLNCNNAG